MASGTGFYSWFLVLRGMGQDLGYDFDDPTMWRPRYNDNMTPQDAIDDYLAEQERMEEGKDS